MKAERNEIKDLQTKVVEISEKYLDLVDRYIDQALQKKEISGMELQEIGDGIKILNHASGTLLKLCSCGGASPQLQNADKWEPL